MGFDIRLPLGVLLTAIGVLLVAFGIGGDHAQYARSLGINVNLWWGLLMTAVGAGFIVSTRRR